MSNALSLSLMAIVAKALIPVRMSSVLSSVITTLKRTLLELELELEEELEDEVEVVAMLVTLPVNCSLSSASSVTVAVCPVLIDRISSSLMDRLTVASLSDTTVKAAMSLYVLEFTEEDEEEDPDEAEEELLPLDEVPLLEDPDTLFEEPLIDPLEEFPLVEVLELDLPPEEELLESAVLANFALISRTLFAFPEESESTVDVTVASVTVGTISP